MCKFDGFQEFRAKRGNYISGGRGLARRISKRESLIIAYLFTYLSGAAAAVGYYVNTPYSIYCKYITY